VAGVYRPRHPERTVLYRVLFHYFDRFLAEYESRFEKEYGFLRPITKEVVERYLDCGNPRCGFARIRCPDCGEERLLMFSCRTRGFCPSCHAKRLEEWGEWMREELLLDVPHRQVVFTIPKMLRLFFKYNRRLLGSLCRLALRSLTRYFEVLTGNALMPGVIAAIQTFGDRINFHPHLHFLVTEGGVDEAGVFHKIPGIDDSRLAEIFAREVLADLVRKELLSPEWTEKILSWRHTGFSVHSRVRAKAKKEAERVGKYMIRPLLSLERLSLNEKRAQVCYRYGKKARKLEWMDYLEFIARVTSHIPDKGQVTVRYYGRYANAHRGKVQKSEQAAHPLLLIEQERPPTPRHGWAEMIRKVYEVDPLTCVKCGGTMKIIAFLTDYAVVDKIINHLKLTFVPDRPPPPQLAYQEFLMAAERSAEYFS
jgi:ribosomal protein S27E